MIVREEEAKKMFCPFRAILLKPLPGECVGSECMMWCWHVYSPRVEYCCGYCGLIASMQWAEGGKT